MTSWLTPGRVLVVLVGWGVLVVAGYLVGRRKGRTVAGLWLTAVFSLPGLVILVLCPRRGPAETAVAPDVAAEPLTAVGSIQPEWDETLAQTDSWIWRLPGVTPAHASEGAADKRGPLGSPLLRRWDGQQS